MDGVCHICGCFGKLSFEHVPPRKAFNNRPVLMAYGRELFESKRIDEIEMTKQQKGAGYFTLCVKCNNDTGGWYGRAYVEWVNQAAEIIIRSHGEPLLYYPYKIHPLRVIKQIVTMFFSVNSPEFREKQRYLEQFVLNKNLKDLPDNIDVYVGYTNTGYSRTSAVSGILSSTRTYVVSEIAFPPFVYIMTFGCISPDPRLMKITHFSKYNYEDFRTLDICLPVVSVNTPYPADYRAHKQVYGN